MEATASHCDRWTTRVWSVHGLSQIGLDHSNNVTIDSQHAAAHFTSRQEPRRLVTEAWDADAPISIFAPRRSRRVDDRRMRPCRPAVARAQGRSWRRSTRSLAAPARRSARRCGRRDVGAPRTVDAAAVRVDLRRASRPWWLYRGGRRDAAIAQEHAEDDASSGESEILGLEIGPDDAVVGLSASGRTPYALGALGAARRAGALTVALVSVPSRSWASR